MKKTNLLILSTVLFFACRSTDRKENILKSDDTVEIISAVLNGREFLKENPHLDTVFFLRNKLFNASWLKIPSRFKISSLEDNSRTRMTNIGPGFPYDKRQRLSLFKFDYINDTAEVSIYEHGGHLFYNTKLNLKNGNWRILQQQASSGGKLDKFEFENEEWYKELKKKTMLDRLITPQ